MLFGPSFSAPVTAAGAVLWRGEGNAREVLVAHHRGGGWCFPKGRTAPGEHMTAAAVRAVSAVARTAIRLGPWLGDTNYVNEGWPEHVDYFAAEAPGVEDAADLLWLSPGRAADALSRPDDVRILEEFECRVRTSTSSVILMCRAPYLMVSILSAYGAGDPCFGDDPERALRIAGEAFAAGRPAALCAERPAIQELFHRLVPTRVPATVPAGGLLVLHGTPYRIVAVERHVA